ncbi:class I SAM-dependent methyltransferase [Candidatus Woesearchaeota archaeon]|nr:class I SAM-dependent methyltransferase [Candidatus Woesearchaeota archaeon]
MLLNKIEFFLMNNPIRKLIQDKIEAKTLRKASNLPKEKNVLEIGCGSGTGTLLINKYFSPKSISAIDLDPRMISKAKNKVKLSNVTFEVGSATKLPYKSKSFDAVFDFGVIHHIPNWKDSIKELKRVLKKNGLIILEDLSIDTFNTVFGRLLKIILFHPYKEMYSEKEFVNYLKKSSFKIKIYQRHYPLYLIKYFIIVAKK